MEVLQGTNFNQVCFTTSRFELQFETSVQTDPPPQKKAFKQEKVKGAHYMAY